MRKFATAVIYIVLIRPGDEIKGSCIVYRQNAEGELYKYLCMNYTRMWDWISGHLRTGLLGAAYP